MVGLQQQELIPASKVKAIVYQPLRRQPTRAQQCCSAASMCEEQRTPYFDNDFLFKQIQAALKASGASCTAAWN